MGFEFCALLTIMFWSRLESGGAMKVNRLMPIYFSDTKVLVLLVDLLLFLLRDGTLFHFWLLFVDSQSDCVSYVMQPSSSYKLLPARSLMNFVLSVVSIIRWL